MNRSEYNKTYRAKNLERINARMAQYRKENREKLLQQKRAYYQENKDRLCQEKKQFRREHPDKELEYQLHNFERSAIKLTESKRQKKARWLVGCAVRIGLIVKPEICSVCKSLRKRFHIQAHHPDYFKPLDVIWCCPTCHAKLDHNHPNH